MQLRVGDRFIDNDEEGEVVEAPSTRTGGKAVWDTSRSLQRGSTVPPIVFLPKERASFARLAPVELARSLEGSDPVAPSARVTFFGQVLLLVAFFGQD